jgi:uncharacterized membrane protein
MSGDQPTSPLRTWPRRSPGSIALASSGWVVLAATALPSGSIVRAACALVFVLSCPGAALVRFWPDPDVLERTVLAVALSTAIAMLVAEGLVVMGAWSSWLAIVLLATITTAAALLPARAEKCLPRDRI